MIALEVGRQNKKENTIRAARVFPESLSYEEELLFQPRDRVARGGKEKSGEW
jgi:hypothetical protein